MTDYYALLGVTSKATKAEIKKNYRLLAAKLHPDKNPSPDAATKFIAITEAYEVLSNKKSRARYDLIRWEQLKRKNQPDHTFTTVVPPTESLRSRRNKAQQKRGVSYQNTQDSIKKQFQLMQEGLYILGRYIFHILGIPLILVIAYSVLNQLQEAFELGVGRGIGLVAFVGLLAYGLFRIGQHLMTDLKKDLNLFAVYYKITRNRAAFYFVLVFFLVSLLIIAVLIA